MKRLDVVIALEGLREAREKWGKARSEFFSGYEAVLTRLVHEGAANFMSDRDIATALGVSPGTVRKKMRAIGLDSRSKTTLSQKAAEALANNAALMGIEPHEMDLMSPLAYLPMGEKMKRELQDKRVSQVHEVSGNTDLTERERAAVDSAAAMYGPTNGDLITLINVLLADRARG